MLHIDNGGKTLRHVERITIMNTIILYATKHGAAADIAQRIAKQIENAVTYDLKQGNIPQLNEYDCVIIGSSVYAGGFRKEAKSFLSKNAEELLKKKLGLFVSGMSESESNEVFKSNVPGDVLMAAVAKGALGGAFYPDKANIFERLIMRIVTKQSGFVSTISDEKISKFVDAMKA
jgi:menaquinone-dependent protoporphyrinogen oxidase